MCVSLLLIILHQPNWPSVLVTSESSGCLCWIFVVVSGGGGFVGGWGRSLCP